MDLTIVGEQAAMTDNVPVVLCKDCRYYITGSCRAPENMQIDLVEGGKKPYNTPFFLRSSSIRCGEEAQWFESKAVA